MAELENCSIKEETESKPILLYSDHREIKTEKDITDFERFHDCLYLNIKHVGYSKAKGNKPENFVSSGKNTKTSQNQSEKYNKQKSFHQNDVKSSRKFDLQKEIGEVAIKKLKTESEHFDSSAALNEAEIKLEASFQSNHKLYESKTDGSDGLQEFLEAIEPKRRKRKSRKKREPSKEEEEAREMDGEVAIKKLKTESEHFDCSAELNEAKIKLEADFQSNHKSYGSETDGSDGLQEFLEAIEPKKRKRKSRKKRELTKEEEEAREKESLRKRTCQICSMVFSIPKGLHNHMRVKHTFEKPYSCEICGERFSVQSTYALHRRRHLGIKPHLCNVCGKNFLRNTDLRIHMWTHNKDRNIKCDVCSNAYSSIISLKKHILIKHTDPSEWKHKCQVCGKKFASTTTLGLHTKQHNDDRSFKCHICGKGFYTNQNMKVHVRTHSAATTFNCDICTKGYRSNEALQRHRLKMHNIGEEKSPSLPKYFCSVCNEGFLQKARLEKHIRLHETGEEEYPFECEPCAKQYKDKNFFSMHMENKHGVVIDDNSFKTDTGFKVEPGHSYRVLVYKEENNEEEIDEMP